MEDKDKTNKSIYDKFMNLLFPPVCLCCSALLDFRQEGIFCKECAAKWADAKNELCRHCAKPIYECSCGIKGDTDNLIPEEHHIVQYDSNYGGTVGQVLYNLKGKNNVTHFMGIAKEFYCNFYSCYQLDNTVVVAVPRSKHANKSIGHDQSVKIAKAFCRLSGLKLCKVIEHKGNTIQKRLDRRGRALNAKRSYFLMKSAKDKLKGKNVILIDDTVTTGATVLRCAKLLKQGGAKNITVYCVAKVV